MSDFCWSGRTLREGGLVFASQSAAKSCQVYERSPNMTVEMPPQVLATATGFAAREALALLRKHDIATAPLLLRAGPSEHGLASPTLD
jgi:hypothetical protein